MSELPKDLENYEFVRYLEQDAKMPLFWHLIQPVDPQSFKPILTPDNQPDKKDWNWEAMFPETSKNIEIEIGCGKGGFLIDYSRLKPELNLLGLEVDISLARYCAERFTKHKCENVRSMRCDAMYWFRDYIKDNTVSGFHMYFPDPWPKKRHHKNRLMKLDFISEVRRIAKDGSLFYWGTDHAEYNAEVMELFNSLDWLECVEPNAGPTFGIETNFEKIFKSQGVTINRSVWRIHK